MLFETVVASGALFAEPPPETAGAVCTHALLMQVWPAPQLTSNEQLPETHAPFDAAVQTNPLPHCREVVQGLHWCVVGLQYGLELPMVQFALVTQFPVQLKFTQTLCVASHSVVFGWQLPATHAPVAVLQMGVATGQSDSVPAVQSWHWKF